MNEHNENGLGLIDAGISFLNRIFDSGNDKRRHIEAIKEYKLRLRQAKYNYQLSMRELEQNYQLESRKIQAQYLVIEKMINASIQVFNRKMNFLENQRNQVNSFYISQKVILEDARRNIETELLQSTSDVDKYTVLSNSRDIIAKDLRNLNAKYNEFQIKLTATLEKLNLQLPNHSNSFLKLENLNK